jgi:hypothetical protein
MSTAVAAAAQAAPIAAQGAGGPSLAEAIDRILEAGAVLDGQIVISLAGIDLVYLGVRALLASVAAAERAGVVLPSRPRTAL